MGSPARRWRRAGRPAPGAGSLRTIPPRGRGSGGSRGRGARAPRGRSATRRSVADRPARCGAAGPAHRRSQPRSCPRPAVPANRAPGPGSGLPTPRPHFQGNAARTFSVSPMDLFRSPAHAFGSRVWPPAGGWSHEGSRDVLEALSGRSGDPGLRRAGRPCGRPDARLDLDRARPRTTHQLGHPPSDPEHALRRSPRRCLQEPGQRRQLDLPGRGRAAGPSECSHTLLLGHGPGARPRELGRPLRRDQR